MSASIQPLHPARNPVGEEIRRQALLGDELSAKVFRDWQEDHGEQPDFAFEWDQMRRAVLVNFGIPKHVLESKE